MRTEIIGDCTLYLGDCRSLIDTFPRNAAIVSDPPYGMKWDTDSSRFSGGHRQSVTRRFQGRSDWGAVENDDVAFDPLPWIRFRECTLWGANHYAGRLPVGTTLVWLKRFDTAFGSFLSDAEIAWEKGGHGVYCRRDLSMNHATGSTYRLHPTQKPIGIMQWCIERTDAAIVIDPFMGSATTAVAAVSMGRKFIGVEIDERHFETACRRVAEAYKQPDLFVSAPAPKAEQLSLLEAAE